MRAMEQSGAIKLIDQLRKLTADAIAANLPSWSEDRLQALLSSAEHLLNHPADVSPGLEQQTVEKLLNCRQNFIYAQKINRFGVIQKQLNSSFLSCSDSVFELFRIVESERGTADLNRLSVKIIEEDREKFLRMFEPPNSENSDASIEIKLSFPDCSSIYLKCVANWTPGENGNSDSLLVVLQDVTENRQAALLMEIQHEITIAVNTAVSLEELAVQMLAIVARVDGIDRSMVGIRNIATGKFDIVAQRGCSDEIVERYKQLDTRFFVDTFELKNYPLYFNYEDVRKFELKKFGNFRNVHSMAVVPVIIAGQLELVLGYSSTSLRVFPVFARNIIELIGADIGAVVGRMMAEQALKQSEENYRLLVENQSDLIVKVGVDGQILFASNACGKFFNCPVSEAVGRRLSAFFPRRDLVRLMHQMDSLNKPPHYLVFEQQIGSGENERWLSWQCNAIFDPNGSRMLAYLGIGRDITENKKSENLLRQSERRLRLILRAVSDCIWDWNLVNDDLALDRKFYEMLGYSPDEIKITIFDIIRNFVHIEDRRRVEHDIRDLIDGSTETFDCSFRMRRRDGNYFWVLMRAVVVKDIQNEPVRMVGCLEDITDRRDYDRMKEHYTFLQKMLDALPLPVFYKNMTGKYLGFNKAMYRNFEAFRRSNVIGQTAFDLWGEENRNIAEKIEFEEKKLVQEGGHSSYVLQVAEEENCMRELVIHKSLVYTDAGDPECMVGAIIDVTDLKKTENALKIASQRLNTILNVMHEIIIWFDRDMRVVWANRAAYEAFGGLTGRDITGMRCRDIWFPQRQHVENGKTSEGERDDFAIGKGGGKEVFRLGDGRFFETWFYPVNTSSEDGGWIQLALDVSEQEKARNESRLKQEQLIQADKMTSLGILVSGVAHEINNPNNFIVINVSILKKAWENILKLLDEYAGEKGEFNVAGVPYSKFSLMVTDLLEGIEEGAERIRVIVNDLKDYVRQTPTDLKGTFNANDALSRAFTLCRNMIKRATNNYKIVYGNNLPLVKGDVYRVEQVIINVVQNACHALKSRESAITVSTCCCDGNEVMIEVMDEGVGILPENLKHITDPFFTTKRDIGGTGLGLAISSAIIEEHNGRLQIESVAGAGTTVRIFLPVASNSDRVGDPELPVGKTAFNSKRQEDV